MYISWQTDRIIGTELWRNMGLCLICVFLLTLLLLADIKICFLVMTCVLFTMVAVTGGLYFWNQVRKGSLRLLHFMTSSGLILVILLKSFFMLLQS